MPNERYFEQRQSINVLIRQFADGVYIHDPIEDTWIHNFGYRSWFAREKQSAALHPVIDTALQRAQPANLYALVLEYPHIPDSGDATKIAYTRNEADGERDRQTVTTAAKYLTRHFPTLQPHEVRDITVLLGKQEFHIWDTTEDFIRAVQEGPRSCMQWDDDDLERRGGHHPYEVYLPSLGWRMAVRIESHHIMGRCLLNVEDDNRKMFVRSYARDPNGGFSHSDTALEAWLRTQGFERVSDWDGCVFAYLETRPYGDPIGPYLDGDAKHVKRVRDGWRITQDEYQAEYVCNNTDGSMDECNGAECNDCGDRFDEDDGIYVGYHSDCLVCPNCHDNYRHVYGRRGREYYVHEDNAVLAENGNLYHNEYLADNNIVELENGDYDDLDNCVEIAGYWYNTDDSRVVRLTDTDEYALEDEGCWQCYESDNWYSDSEEYVVIDGNKYHPDSDAAQQQAEEQSETNEE